MRNTYPRKSRYLVFRKLKDGIQMKHVLTEEVWRMSVEEARFIRALDGKTNPYRLGFGRAFTDSLLAFLGEEELLDDGERKLNLGIGSVLFALCIPDVKTVHRIAGFLWNHLLMFAWLPIFVLGLCISGTGNYVYIEGGWATRILGIYVGMAIGLVFHELSHAAAALNYGGALCEIGVMIRFFLMPGAYCLIDYNNVKDRFKRAQISASGPECNLLLSGIFLCMMKLETFPSEFMICAGGINCFLAMLNLSLVGGLDGSAVFEEIFGCPNFIRRAIALLFDKSGKNRLRNSGITGQATLAACYVICVLQTLLPIFLFMQAVSIFVLFATLFF